jgi:hypothetical protein
MQTVMRLPASPLPTAVKRLKESAESDEGKITVGRAGTGQRPPFSPLEFPPFSGPPQTQGRGRQGCGQGGQGWKQGEKQRGVVKFRGSESGKAEPNRQGSKQEKKQGGNPRNRR